MHTSVRQGSGDEQRGKASAGSAARPRRRAAPSRARCGTAAALGGVGREGLRGERGRPRKQCPRLRSQEFGERALASERGRTE